MSIDSVVGRIGQILAMEQQVVSGQTPASPISATPALDGSQTTSATGGSDSTSFSNALTSALGGSGQSSALPALQLNSTGGDARVQAMVNMANSLVGKPYVWGGGHAGFGPTSGYDCSGFVSAVLHAGGYLSAPADTTSMPSQPGIEAGPGQHVTIYDRAKPGDTGHVIMSIDGQFYESGGSAGAWGGGGGVEKIGRPSDSYLATFDTILHPAGL
jgi:cell wall-associated NlpC family hydrolase